MSESKVPLEDVALIDAARQELQTAAKNTERGTASPSSPEPAPTSASEGATPPPAAAAIPVSPNALAAAVLRGDLVVAPGRQLDVEALKKLVVSAEIVSLVGEKQWDVWGFPPGSKEATLEFLVPHLSLDAEGKTVLASKEGPVPLNLETLAKFLGPLAGRLLPPRGFPGSGGRPPREISSTKNARSRRFDVQE